MSFARVQPYVLSMVIALAAVPLTLRHEQFLAVGALILGFASFVQTKRLQAIPPQKPARTLQDAERACKAQVFASVDELSAGIAHEINNPLAIIAQETEWLQHLFENHSLQELHENDDCKDCLREISHQVDRCKEIVKKLLSLARQMKPVIQDMDINNVLRNLISLAQRDACERNITIVAQLDPHVPIMSSDPPLLRQVFLNLLVNATHAIDHDGRIVIGSKLRENDWVEISIQDNGRGIAPEHLGKIFTPFFSTKPEGKGTGLGLAMCRGIVARLGGEITVTSDPGLETTFTVLLPIHCPGGEGDTRNAA